MKQAFLYALKVYVTGTLLAIIISGLICYNMYYKSYDNFHMSYHLLYSQFTDLWMSLLPGSIVILFLIAWLFQWSNAKDWPAFKKRKTIFLIGEALPAVLILIVRLVAKRELLVPAILLWLIYSVVLGLCIILYYPKTASDFQKKFGV